MLVLSAVAPSCVDIGNGAAAGVTGGAGASGASAGGASSSAGAGGVTTGVGGSTSTAGTAGTSAVGGAGDAGATGSSGQGGMGTGGSGGASGAGGASAGTGGIGGNGRDLSPDRTKFFGVSRCAGSGLQLCEDFESGTIDASVWSIRGKTPVIDGVQKARGAKALHIHVKSDISMGGGGYISSGLTEKKTFPAASNRYYGRMFVYFQALPVPTASFTFSHWTMIGGSGTGVTGDIRVSGFLQNGKNRFGVGTDSGTDPKGTGDWTTLDDDPKGNFKPVPLADWQCIEWMNDGEHNETAFFWDATEHASMHTTGTVHGGNAANPYVLPQFTQTWMGFEVYQGGGEDYEMWVDEIAIDKERIGCIY